MYFRISSHARDLARGAVRRGQLDQVLDIWSAASDAERDDVQLLAIAGDTFARRGRWEDAADVFERLVERQPARNRNWFLLAPLLVYTDQLERYHEYRRELLASFGDATDPITAERTSKASLLIPVPRADAVLSHELASQAVTAGANHGLLPYFWFAKGMSEYRIGEYRSAIDTLEQSRVGNRSRWPYLDVVVHLFLAMSHQQLEERETARQQFREAERIFAERLPAGDSADIGVDWLDWLICDIARREASRPLSHGAP
jgi:tetratricopeptide (TPR) repeat protein